MAAAVRHHAVQVPATSANLGPGFDAFGLAVDRYLAIRTVARSGQVDRVTNVTGDDLPTGDDNLVWRSFVRFCEIHDVAVPDVGLRAANEALALGRGGVKLVAAATGLARSTLGRLRAGDVVNVEPALRAGEPMGQLVDLSAGGVRIRCTDSNVKPDGQIRVRLALPDYAGICPFVDTSSHDPQPKREWIGWMTVARVNKVNDNTADIAGRLVDMDEMDRGMLGLYLSTQPLAA